MRRSGETTRAINQAIEILFTKGEVIIPPVKFTNYQEYQQYFRGWKPERIELCVFDPDAHINRSVQIELFKSVMRRLDFEHGNPNVEINQLKGTIKLR